MLIFYFEIWPFVCLLTCLHEIQCGCFSLLFTIIKSFSLFHWDYSSSIIIYTDDSTIYFSNCSSFFLRFGLVDKMHFIVMIFIFRIDNILLFSNKNFKLILFFSWKLEFHFQFYFYLTYIKWILNLILILYLFIFTSSISIHLSVIENYYRINLRKNLKETAWYLR